MAGLRSAVAFSTCAHSPLTLSTLSVATPPVAWRISTSSSSSSFSSSSPWVLPESPRWRLGGWAPVGAGPTGMPFWRSRSSRCRMCETAFRSTIALESVGTDDGNVVRSALKPVLIDLGVSKPEQPRGPSTRKKKRETHSRRFCSESRWATRRFWPPPPLDGCGCGVWGPAQSPSCPPE